MKPFYKYFLKFFLPIFVLPVLLTCLAYWYYIDEEYDDLVTESKNRLLFKEEFIQNYLTDAIADMIYLGNSDIPERAISGHESRDAALKDLTLFARTTRRYDQLRILDTTGQEFMRINYVNKKAQLLSPELLQNKSHRFYFIEAKQLKPGNIYISPFDLNVEHKKIEKPYKPVVRLIMRIDNEQGLQGYLVINMLLDKFFKELSHVYPSYDHLFMLLNNDGYWLKAPPNYKEYMFMFESKRNISFPRSFKNEWAQILRNNDNGVIKTENGLFVFNRINFKDFFKDLPYLSDRFIVSSDDNNFIALYFIPNALLNGMLHKNLPYFLVILLLLTVFSAAFAYIRAKAKMNDIVTSKRLRQKRKKLELLVSELSNTNTQLRQFSQIVSHNLRSPVANLSMLVSHLSDANSEEERNDLMRHLQSVNDAINMLMNDLIDTVKILNKHDLQLEQCQLSRALKKTKLILKNDIETSNAQINSDFSQWEEIQYPSLYFDNIMLNLVSNAIKFRNPEKQLIIELHSFYESGYQALSISDNGLGIDMERHKHSLFGLYKRFHRGRHGKGLGLFMVKTQVESMGGRVTAESQENKGSLFTVYFKRTDLI